METQKYKTRTEFRPRANGSLPGVWPCALDVGYSSVKVFSPNMTACFPSFAKPFEGEFVGELSSSHIIYHDYEEDRYWLVGDAAQRDMDQGDTTVAEEAVFGRKRYDDPMFLVLIRVGLALGCRTNQHGDLDHRTIYVQTGLPPKYIKKDTPLMKRAIAGHHEFGIKIANDPEEKIVLDIDPAHIDVTEQPKGTLLSIAMDNQHHFVKDAVNYFRSNVLIFDAGFGTLDIFPIVNNLVREKQTFTEYSMRQVLQNTISRIYETYGEEVSMIGMQRCLERGTVLCYDNFSSREEPFEAILEEESRAVCDAALENIGRIYNLPEYDYFVITGGTGAAWNEQIREKLKGLHALKIISANQPNSALPFLYANVRGYYMKMYSQLSKDRRNGTL